jgi:hypothetical protein
MRIVLPFVFSALLLGGCDRKPVVERRLGKKEKPHQDTSVLQAADLTGKERWDADKGQRKTQSSDQEGDRWEGMTA